MLVLNQSLSLSLSQLLKIKGLLPTALNLRMFSISGKRKPALGLHRSHELKIMSSLFPRSMAASSEKSWKQEDYYSISYFEVKPPISRAQYLQCFFFRIEHYLQQ
ncbi:hypothetical protein KIL84_015286 [Mauremys mutica]|uniref:Uncharacterized protein n=1 Tax=Mauremys mutica TaxID=74926 RepID=A0A9D3WQG1_9SAUR|nr:hypothetical protein KIL84_015286 [Mauremys mutica]